MWLANYQQMIAKTRQEGRGEDVWRGEADPYNKWMLVEWEYNDNPSSTRLWIDGKPVIMSQKEQKGETAQFHWPAGSETNSNLWAVTAKWASARARGVRCPKISISCLTTS